MSRLSAQDWIHAAVEQTARGGAHSVRVEPLAKTLGVSKGSFYWHFKDRAALLEQMLAYWEDAGTQGIIAQLDAKIADPSKRLDELVSRAFASTPVELAFETALRAWASTDPAIFEVVQRVDTQRIAYVVGLLQQDGLKAKPARDRATLFYSMLVGDMLRRTYGKKAVTKSQIAVMRGFLRA